MEFEHFRTRDAISAAYGIVLCLSVLPSVHLSVTSRYTIVSKRLSIGYIKLDSDTQTVPGLSYSVLKTNSGISKNTGISLWTFVPFLYVEKISS